LTALHRNGTALSCKKSMPSIDALPTHPLAQQKYAHYVCLFFFKFRTVWRTRKSKWFNQINFDVTQFTSYFNERSKNFIQRECEEHFYPKQSPRATEVDCAALRFFEFGGLLSICISMFTFSLLVLLSEIVFSKYFHRKLQNNTEIIPKIIQYSYKCKCADHLNAIKKFHQVQNCIMDENCIVILRSEALTNICGGGRFEISIALVMQLNLSHQEPGIAEQLQSLSVYLDSISLI
jgi:hypothetical protein